MKNLKSLKKFKSEGLELNKNQQLKISGGLTDGSGGFEGSLSESYYYKPTEGGECGDCNRYSKTDEGFYVDPNKPYNVVRVAGVDAQDCHI